ncbi:MAG: DUF4240 domain-containing protein [Lyngbya sp. HA4199-MV5]|jgi:hypothetical protein|nr:DUF4240 domain-containing protein [Lyngbya sp. HA4199-MV5]
MTEDQFWEIIEASRQASSDCEAQADALQESLSELAASEIMAFDQIFHQKLVGAYHWDVWGVAYLVNGGCSDDCFEYFRAWLIGQGKAAYEQVLADPQSIVSILENSEDEVECEALMYASHSAYESLEGEVMPVLERMSSPAPAGEPWEEQDLEERFPKVAERCA